LFYFIFISFVRAQYDAVHSTRSYEYDAIHFHKRAKNYSLITLISLSLTLILAILNPIAYIFTLNLAGLRLSLSLDVTQYLGA